MQRVPVVTIRMETEASKAVAKTSVLGGRGEVGLFPFDHLIVWRNGHSTRRAGDRVVHLHVVLPATARTNVKIPEDKSGLRGEAG